MSIFWNHHHRGEIHKFETYLAKILGPTFPAIEYMVTQTKLFEIEHIKEPPGIHLTHEYNHIDGKSAMVHKNYFRLRGVFVKRKKDEKYIEVGVVFLDDVLNKIEVENPETFHHDFHMHDITLGNLVKEEVILFSGKKKVVNQVLDPWIEKLTHKLELEHSREVDINGKKYYTILDMGQSNYIAIDLHGRVFRIFLEHGNEPIKMIADNIRVFLKENLGERIKLIEKYFEAE